MSTPRRFTPQTREELSLVLDQTRQTMSEVRQNMRIIAEGRNRADRRIEKLQKEAEQARCEASKALVREKTLDEERRETRSQLEAEQGEHARTVEELSVAQQAGESLQAQLSVLSDERDQLVVKADQVEGVLEQKADLERQLAEVTVAVSTGAEAFAELQQQLRRFEELQGVLERDLARATASGEALESQLLEERERAEQQTAARSQLEQECTETRDVIEGLEAQLAAEAELRHALKVDLDLSRRVIEELKQALTESDGDP